MTCEECSGRRVPCFPCRWMEMVWRSPDLRPIEKLAAVVYVEDTRRGHLTVTNERLADRCGVTLRTAAKARAGLVAAGFLDMREGGAS